jgi:hypothetical protein
MVIGAGLCADSMARASAARVMVPPGVKSAVFAMRADAIRISR